jgi:hypothetical protein
MIYIYIQYMYPITWYIITCVSHKKNPWPLPSKKYQTCLLEARAGASSRPSPGGSMVDDQISGSMLQWPSRRNRWNLEVPITYHIFEAYFLGLNFREYPHNSYGQKCGTFTYLQSVGSWNSHWMVEYLINGLRWCPRSIAKLVQV